MIKTGMQDIAALTKEIGNPTVKGNNPTICSNNALVTLADKVPKTADVIFHFPVNSLLLKKATCEPTRVLIKDFQGTVAVIVPPKTKRKEYGQDRIIIAV